MLHCVDKNKNKLITQPNASVLLKYKNKEYPQRGKCPESRLRMEGRPTMKTLNHARIQVTLRSAHLVSH